MTESAVLTGTTYAQRKAEAETLAANILEGLSDDYPGLKIEARNRLREILVTPDGSDPFTIENMREDTVETLTATIRSRLESP